MSVHYTISRLDMQMKNVEHALLCDVKLLHSFANDKGSLVTSAGRQLV